MAQAINLQIAPSNVMPKIYASQFDIGREIEISLYDGASAYTPPVGTDIRFEGKKPDGNGFSYACTYTGNVVTVVTTDQMTVLAGEIPCELRMSLNGDDIGTLNIIFVIEKSPIDENVPISDTEIPAIIELARDEQYNAEAWATGERNGVPVGPTDPQYHNNAKYWAEHAEYGALDDLTDVEITTPSNGQALLYDANSDEWKNGNVVKQLNDLSDTAISAPANGQLLVYDNAASKWENKSVGIDDLKDATITTPAEGDGLIYDNIAQKWKNIPIISRILTLFNAWKKNGAYNLCPNNWTTQSVGGITFTTRSDKTIAVANGSPSALIYVMPISNFAPVHLPVGRYKMVAFPDTGITGTKYFFFKNVTTNTTYLITNNNGIFDVTDASHEWYCAYSFDTTTVFSDNVVLYPMITTDLNATYADYVPNAMTNRELTEKVTGTSGGVTKNDTYIASQNITYIKIGQLVIVTGSFKPVAIGIPNSTSLFTGIPKANTNSFATAISANNNTKGYKLAIIANNNYITKDEVLSSDQIDGSSWYNFIMSYLTD